MTVPGVFEHRVGDLWRVAKVDPIKGVTYERVRAEPGQYRRRGDGLHPNLPDVEPVSDEEARRCADEMDAAMVRGRVALEEWPFSPDNPVNQALEAARDCPAHDTRCRPGNCVLLRAGTFSRPRGITARED